MSLVNFPSLPSHPDNMTSLTFNGYDALVALGPGTTTLAAGGYWYGSYIRLVFGNDPTLTNSFINHGIIYNHGSGTISALGANNIGYEWNDGIIVAQSSNGPAYGSGSDSGLAGFANFGEIYAFSGTTNATAFWDFSALAFVYNAGLLAAHSDATDQGTGSADALAQFNGGGILNDRTGTLLAEGPYARGLMVGRGTILPNSVYQIVNLGEIHAVSTRPGQPSYGVSANGLDVEFMHVYNDGIIKADIAYYIEPPYGNGGSNQLFVNDVHGAITGDLSPTAGNDLIVNSGTVDGAVKLGSGADVYFGLFGQQSGNIVAGPGGNIIVGTAAADTIMGGLGNDVIVGAGGGDVLSGGGGANRFGYLSLADSTPSAPDKISDFKSGTDVIDLSALGLAGITITTSGAVSTIHAVSGGVQFSIEVSSVVTEQDVILAPPVSNESGLAGNDLLLANSGGSHLVGGAGNDILFGGVGPDVLDAGLGNNVLIGGTGQDVAVFHGNYSDFMFAWNNDGGLVVADRNLYAADGTSVLYGIERLRFADRSVNVHRFGDPGGALIANFNPASGWSSQTMYPRHVADVNGDGHADIVGFGQAGVLVSYGSAAGTFSSAALVVSNFGQSAGWTSDNQFHRELADVNGDGRADIVGFGAAGTLVSLAKADGTFATPFTAAADFGTAQGWASQDGFARTIGDVNGDGKADLIGFGSAGTLVALGKGDGTFQTAKLATSNFGVAQGWTSDTAFHRAVGDVNADGKADLIGFGQAGVLVALSNGDGTFGTATLALANFGAAQGWTSNDAYARFAADVNHDGKADLIGFGAAGTLVAYGNGDGTFTAASNDLANFGAAQGWTSDATFHRELADLNHDGLPDIVGFGAAGVLAAMNQGDFVL